MRDNGCQPTSLAFQRTCATLGIRQAFTSYGNPKGNADTERLVRTWKEELVSHRMERIAIHVLGSKASRRTDEIVKNVL